MAKKAYDLQSKLKRADPEIRAYVAELKKRNGRLQAENVDRQNRIKALQKSQVPGAGLAERLQSARERAEPELGLDPEFFKKAKELLAKARNKA